ncbi:MAG: hypothetical protein IJ131_03940 [Eggerthellaceae bacterium]|nr:hypothetical protein [Eggerthellaceae bacterium]
MNDNIKSMAFSCGAAAISMGHTNEPTAFDRAWDAICRAYGKWTGETTVAATVEPTMIAAQSTPQSHAA